MPDAFEKIKTYCPINTEISLFEKEFISGSFRYDFYERLQVHINSLANTQIAIQIPVKYDLFFSFSSKNKDEADVLVIELRKCGVNVFYSGDDLKQHIGQDYFEKINIALECSQNFVLLCTPESMASKWVKREYGTFYATCHMEAEDERCFFVLEGKQFEEKLLPAMLKNLQRPTLSELLGKLGKTHPHEKIIKDLQTDKTRLQTELEEANTELARLQARNETLSRQEKQAKITLEAEQEKIHELEARLLKPSKENAELQRQIQEKETQITTLKKDLASKEVKITELQKDINAKQTNIDSLKKDLTTKEAKITELQTNLDNLKKDLTNKDTKINQQTTALTDGQKLYKQLQEKYNTQETTLKQKDNKITELQKQVEKEKDNAELLKIAQKEINQKDLKISQQTKALQEAQTIYQQLQNKYDTLLPEYNRLKQKEEKSKTHGFFEVKVKDIPFKMVFIKGGTFLMGSPKSEIDRGDDETQHSVTLSDYYIAETQVTQALWQAVMGSNPSHFAGKLQNPVEQVSWEDAQAFIKKLNDLVKPPSGIWRLPTEAQWEYACRAGTTTPFYTGNNLTTDQANYNGNYPYNGNAKGIDRETTLPVKSLPANAWGLYDMHGNVWEWCEDWYDENFYNSTDATKLNPINSKEASNRVLRGGSWNSYARNCRSAYRTDDTPAYRDYRVGFRLVVHPF